MLEVEELQLFELDDIADENIAPVASLDDARNSARPHSRPEAEDRKTAATLLG
jgi:hypothetical protein